jgi:hypothetical protein
MDHGQLLKAATVSGTSVDSLDRAELVEKIDTLGLVVVRGLNPPQEISAAKERLRGRFSTENDHAATGESPADLYRNFQKLSVNGGDFRANAHAQCVRSFYNPIFADDIYSMRGIFRRSAQLRNLLMDVPLDWAVEEIQDGFWTAARIHHYPAGGGFMEGHEEIHVPKVYEEAGLKIAYFQPLIVMSKRGKSPGCDYETGGGFFLKDKDKVHYEQWCELGDVLVYDTRVTHGVSTIDVHKRFHQNSLEGRFAAFVTLYKDLSGPS